MIRARASRCAGYSARSSGALVAGSAVDRPEEVIRRTFPVNAATRSQLLHGHRAAILHWAFC